MFEWAHLSWRLLTVLSSLALFIVACGPSATPAPTLLPVRLPLPPTPTLPDTTGIAVRDYLREVNYQKAWELWPGKGELYSGPEPHGMLLTTYLNATAFAALTGKAGVMSDGSIIVKENYMLDGALDSTTVMYKVAQYNPEHNDWFFTKLRTDGAVDVEGRVAGCQGCHSVRKDNDYIYTSSLK